MLSIISSPNDKYFCEFINSIEYFNSRIKDEKINKKIYFQSLHIDDKDNHIIIFNTEQMSVDRWAKQLIQLSYNHPIFDYSLENIKKLNSMNPMSHSTLFPILYHDDLLFHNTQKNYDITFIGWLTERRKIIIDKLIHLGYKVNMITNQYDFKEKYKQILQSKILLNIHAFENYTMFEYARCSIPIFNSQIVISEESVDDKDQDNLNGYILSKVIFEKYDNIVTRIQHVLNNIEKYEYQADKERLKRLTNQEIDRIKNFLIS
jgi:hypothetical protein